MPAVEASSAPDTQVKRMKLRYAGVCSDCGETVAAGVVADYQRTSKTVSCLPCSSLPSSSTTAESRLRRPPAPPQSADVAPGNAALGTSAPDAGTGGASARREYERRKDSREARVRSKHPRIGGLLLAVTDEPQSTKAWAVGAKGEEILARSLDSLAASGVALLHDRRIPRSRANIDHIAIAPSGVFVIDAKNYQGRPHLRVEGGLLRPRVETLMVGRRDCSKLVAGVHKQLALVRTVLDQNALGAATPAQGMLCFVDGDWPLIGGSFTIDGLQVLWPRKAQEHIRRPGPLTSHQVQALHARLASVFPLA